jgi:hypothetical protein
LIYIFAFSAALGRDLSRSYIYHGIGRGICGVAFWHMDGVHGGCIYESAGIDGGSVAIAIAIAMATSSGSSGSTTMEGGG